MHIKTNYFVIPLAIFAVAFLGSLLVMQGLGWYATVKLPDYAPPDYVVSSAWTIIFVLDAYLLYVVWNYLPRGSDFKLIVLFFVLNGAFNVLWSLFFFTFHWLAVALADAALLEVTVAALIILLWPKSRRAAALLFPYAAWVAFAILLNAHIWVLNS